MLLRSICHSLVTPSSRHLRHASHLNISISKIVYPQRLYSTGGNSISKPASKPPLMTRIKEGALHYWNGTKLLVYETKISSKLLLKLLRGEKLIRREYRQLLRTTSDMIRLVPFIIIMIVPFLEFALPVLLKFFPNMLPSTFEDRLQVEEKVKKQLKAKLEVAKFLQDLAETNVASSEVSNRVKELKNLFDKTRSSGETLTAEEVFEVCHHLKSDVTLENLTRPQLQLLTKYMGLKAIGTNNFLRYQIQKAVKSLKEDDKMILQEGINSLTLEELKSACHARGILTINVPEWFMRKELQQWIELQVRHDVSAPILILSRAFALSDEMKMEDAIRVTVTSLPDSVINEAKSRLGTETEQVLDPSEKIEILKQQETLIKDELEQEKEAEKSEKAAVDSKLSSEQIDSISDAVVTLATNDPTKQEKEDLEEIKRDKKEVSLKPMHKTTQAIEDQVEKLIKNIDHEISTFEKEIGRRLQIISPSSDGTISAAQLRAILKMVRNSPKEADKITRAIRTFDEDGDGKIFIRDILSVARKSEEQEGHGVVADEGK